VSLLLRLSPQLPVYHVPREEEVAELVLGMADVSTNLVMLTGPQGVGRSMLAVSMAQELVVSQHWTDAYWVDLQGVTNVVLAGG
jgi:MoxR-like ATPase